MPTRKQGITEGRKQRVQKTIPKPEQVAPMLCTLVREPVNDDNFLYEIKWDGYRIISERQKSEAGRPRSTRWCGRSTSRDRSSVTQDYKKNISSMKAKFRNSKTAWCRN